MQQDTNFSPNQAEKLGNFYDTLPPNSNFVAESTMRLVPKSIRVAASISSYTMRQLPRGKLMQIALNYIELNYS